MATAMASGTNPFVSGPGSAREPHSARHKKGSARGKGPQRPNAAAVLAAHAELNAPVEEVDPYAGTSWLVLETVETAHLHAKKAREAKGEVLISERMEKGWLYLHRQGEVEEIKIRITYLEEVV